MRGDYWIPSQEKYITLIEETMIITALENKLNVIIDATNFNPKTIKKWTKIQEQFNTILETRFFNTPLEICIERDSKREFPVGKNVIINFYNKYINK